MSLLETIQHGRAKTPPRIIVYGPEKIGKSTFASCAPKPIFIRTEDGLDQIDCAKFPLCSSYAQFIEQIGTLCQEPHDFQTLALDSADWLQKLVFAETCMEGKKASIEDFGYGKGYVLALKLWKEVLDGLDFLRNQRGMAIILIAHSKVEKFADPDSSTYDRYSLALDKDATAVLCEWSDAILFANRKIRIEKEEVGFKKIRATAKPIGADGGDRILRCIGSPACVAGNRYDMPAELPLVWDEVAKYL